MARNELILTDVTKRFGGLTAVDALSFKVEDGQIYGIIGPNGAGKTTVFNCITGIYKSEDPAKRASAIVKAVTHYNEPKILAEVSKDLGEPMQGLDVAKLDPSELLQTRGW